MFYIFTHIMIIAFSIKQKKKVKSPLFVDLLEKGSKIWMS